jgi:hypothetical protein
MIFTIGAILFTIGELWFRGAEYYDDWRDVFQLALRVGGALLVMVSLLILAWKYLP